MNDQEGKSVIKKVNQSSRKQMDHEENKPIIKKAAFKKKTIEERKSIIKDVNQ